MHFQVFCWIGYRKHGRTMLWILDSAHYLAKYVAIEKGVLKFISYLSFKKQISVLPKDGLIGCQYLE